MLAPETRYARTPDGVCAFAETEAATGMVISDEEAAISAKLSRHTTTPDDLYRVVAA